MCNRVIEISLEALDFYLESLKHHLIERANCSNDILELERHLHIIENEYAIEKGIKNE